jgi:hypothetical protein
MIIEARHADSLAVPMSEMKKAIETKNADVKEMIPLMYG